MLRQYVTGTLVLFLFFSFLLGEAPGATYVDDLKRKVDVPTVPRRIISLAPNITETLFALGLEREIVGVTEYCDSFEEARSKPKVGNFISLSIERIVALKPDLILCTADGNKRESVEKLERLGLKVYAVNPSTLEEVFKMIGCLGKITGKDGAASRINFDLRKRLRFISSLTEGLTKPRVFFQVGLDSMVTVGRHTFLNEIITLAGGINIAADEEIRYPRYSMERVVDKAPGIVILSSMKGEGRFAEIKKKWMRWKVLPAVRYDRIYLMESDRVFRPSPGILDGIEELVKMIHPEIAGKIGRRL